MARALGGVAISSHIEFRDYPNYSGRAEKASLKQIYAKAINCPLPYPTDNTRVLAAAAVRGLDAIYRPGYAYSTAEVLLRNLRQRGEFTGDLFAAAPMINLTLAGCNKLVSTTQASAKGVFTGPEDS